MIEYNVYLKVVGRTTKETLYSGFKEISANRVFEKAVKKHGKNKITMEKIER